MCAGCYEEMGFPKIINERTLAGVKLVERVYEFCMVGGNLHCELDDWNIDDDFFKEFKPYDPDVPKAQLGAERECFDAFKAMSEDERGATLALRDGYLLSDGQLIDWLRPEEPNKMPAAHS